MISGVTRQALTNVTSSLAHAIRIGNRFDSNDHPGCILALEMACHRRSLLAGVVPYSAGTFLVTMMFNMPHNNALAAVSPESEDGARLWANYLVGWTARNHVCTIAALLATVRPSALLLGARDLITRFR
jgi:Domain of unknown function (DUF1772)